jgi:hypothetical protein
MLEEAEMLKLARKMLNMFLDKDDPALIQRNWVNVQARINLWWTAYKEWEAVDTFDAAFHNSRMTVRTFNPGYNDQVSKVFKRGKLNVTKDKFFADGQYTRATAIQQQQLKNAYDRNAEKQKYHANRGIDSSAFAVPANFASRETKYEAGLHDLSASLVNPKLSIFDQIHNNEDGAHFSFLPLSMEEDQEVLYNLTRFAKDKVTIPQLYPIVRGFRAEMTRVKLAYEMDMAIGYMAVPAPRPGTGPQFKLRYGLGNVTSIVGGGEQPTTREIYEERQQAARKFKSILGVRDAKNEIVIAMRKHAGPFPVFAVRRGDNLMCYRITEAKFMERTGFKITPDGHMVPVEDWNIAALSIDTVAAFDYDEHFRQSLDDSLLAMGQIPKKDGLHVVVAAPPNSANFARICNEVNSRVVELNQQGFKLRFAREANQKYNNEPVALHLRHV